MNSSADTILRQLPEPARQVLQRLLEVAPAALGQDLVSVVLFGSGAEARLRATSDLNLMFVLREFNRDKIDLIREPLRLARMAARAAVMFVLDSELTAAAEAFAVKFDDMFSRHQVLYGDSVLADLKPSRAARQRRLGQILLNLILRLRERYASVSLREEQLAVVIAEAAGPLRAAAFTLCDLEGRPAPSPREALMAMAESLDAAAWPRVVACIGQARQSASLPPGAAPAILLDLIRLAEALRLRAERTL